MINTVLLDFDGTLVNTNHLIVKSFQHTYKTLLNREKPVNEIMKTFGEPLLLTMKREFPENPHEALTIYRDYHHDAFEDLIDIFPGMGDALKRLHGEGIKTAVVTSRLKNTTMQGLEKYGLLEYLDAIITIDDIQNHEPHPESIDVALKKLGSKPENALMVGDSEYDILCAKNAGVKSVLVDWSVMEDEQRNLLAPDYILKNAEQMFDLLL